MATSNKEQAIIPLIANLDLGPLKVKNGVLLSQDTLDGAGSITNLSKSIDRVAAIDNHTDDDFLDDKCTPLRKWRSEFLETRESAGKLKKWDTSYFSPPSKDNPLKKWRELHLKQIKHQTALLEVDDDKIYTSKIGVKAVSEDTIDIQEDRKKLLPDLITQTRNNNLLPIESKLPKLVSIHEKITRPKIVKPKIAKSKTARSASDPRSWKSSLFLQRFLSKSKIAESKSPKALISDLPQLFDDQEPGEFDDDINAMYNIRKFHKTYTIVRQIGAGGHSTVRLAVRNDNSEFVVAKFINATNVWHWHHESGDSKIPLEIWTMRYFKNVNIKGVIKYLDHFQIGDRFIIIMEYLGEQWIDLYDYIELFGPIDEQKAKAIFIEIIKLVKALHTLGYSHNDIKDENIMIHKITQEIKLIDFGSTMPLTNELTKKFYGTQKFSAPEALNGKPYLLAPQEVWTLGTLLYVLLYKMDPFANDDEIEDLDIDMKMKRFLILEPGQTCPRFNLSQNAADAIVVMLTKDPELRISVDGILGLPFFN